MINAAFAAAAAAAVLDLAEIFGPPAERADRAGGAGRGPGIGLRRATNERGLLIEHKAG